MTTKNIFALVGTFIAGIGVGVWGTKSYFARISAEYADAEIEEMKRYYDCRENYLRNASNEELIHTGEKLQSGFNNGVSIDTTRPDDDQQIKIVGKGGRVDYSNMYERKGPAPEDPADKLHPVDSHEDEALSEMLEDFSEGYDSWHKKNKGREPRIISQEVASDLPNYIEVSPLYYYVENAVFTDEDENVIDESHYLLGHAFDRSNFPDNDNKLLYILNYEQDTCYEIHKFNEAFGKE